MHVSAKTHMSMSPLAPDKWSHRYSMPHNSSRSCRSAAGNGVAALSQLFAEPSADVFMEQYFGRRPCRIRLRPSFTTTQPEPEPEGTPCGATEAQLRVGDQEYWESTAARFAAAAAIGRTAARRARLVVATPRAQHD